MPDNTEEIKKPFPWDRPKGKAKDWLGKQLVDAPRRIGHVVDAAGHERGCYVSTPAIYLSDGHEAYIDDIK